MLLISKRAQRFVIATAAALGILALGACSGGGGGGNNLLPQPQQPNPVSQQPPAGTYSGALSAAGMSIALPKVAGFTETLVVPENNAAAGTNLTVKVTSAAPMGMPRLDPDMFVAIPYLYFTSSVNKDVKLNGFPGFTMTVPAGFEMGNMPVKVGFYDPTTGWKHVGDFTLSGRTVTFKPTTTATTLKANVTYYFITYTCGGPSPSPSPSPSPTPTGVLSCTASGTGAIGVLCITGGSKAKTYAFVGKGTSATGNMAVEQVDISGGATGGGSGHIVHTYTSGQSPGVRYTECSSDEKHLRVLCGAFSSAELMDITASTQTDTEYSSDASSELVFSGGTCTICAIAFDPLDTAFILMDPNPTAGGGQFQRVGENSHTIDMTIAAADPNENPGYDYVKNWVVSPHYNSPGLVDIADFGSGKLFTSDSSYRIGEEPDSDNVDVATHVTETPDEFDANVTTLALGPATFNTVAKTFHATGITETLNSTARVCSTDYDDTATDSVLHLTFTSGEYCSPGTIGFFLLPTTSSGVGISDWASIQIPRTPDGFEWNQAHDPHPVAAFNDPVNCPDCGIMVNLGATWMGVIDLNKLMHAPRSKTDSHAIDPTYDLIKNGVLAYYAI